MPLSILMIKVLINDGSPGIFLNSLNALCFCPYADFALRQLNTGLRQER